MRGVVVALLVGLIFVGVGLADEEPQDQPPKPLTPEQAADAVLEAVRASDQDALKGLAHRDNPDPWLVADELCFRAKHDAAEVFAKAAPRSAVEKLSEYVTSRRGKEPDTTARRTLGAMRAALAKRESQKALDLSEDAPKELDTVVGLGLAYARGVALGWSGRPTEGAKALRQVGEAARTLGWLEFAARSFRQGGLSATYGSDWDEAIAAWEARLQVSRALGEKSGVADVLADLGTMHWNRGSYPDALKHYAEALEIRRTLGDKPGTAAVLTQLGTVHWTLGNYRAALKHATEALEIRGALGDQHGIASTLSTMGLIQEDLGDFSEALKCHHGALEIERTLGNRFAVANVRAGGRQVLVCQGVPVAQFSVSPLASP